VAKSNELVQISGLSGSVSIRVLAPGPQAIDYVVLSPRATAAAVHHSGTKTVQIISGLPRWPSAGKEVDISTLPDSPSSFAVSDDAQLLVAIVNRRDSGEILLIDADANTRQVFTGMHLAAAAFMGGTHDLLVADDMNDSIHLVHAVDSSAAAAGVAGRQEGILRPVALDASADGRQVFVVNARPASVVVFDLRNHTAAKYVCHCAPAGLTPLIGRATFVVSQPANGPLWVFDGDAEQPRVVFVPSSSPHQTATQDAAQ
jgi:DNA-binding beta-propeller fold protein YncE